MADEQVDPQAQPAPSKRAGARKGSRTRAPVVDREEPVRVDQFNRRSGEDALEGSRVTVVDGEHAGHDGAFVKVVEADPKTNYPAVVLVRFTGGNYSTEYAVVPYESVRPAEHPGHQ